MNKPFPKNEFAKFLGDKSVLVIEPSTNYRTSIKQFLTNIKVTNVKVVPSVADAKRLLLTEKVGLFIVEWGLSETNGLQFCRDLKKDARFKQTPFLLLSVENMKQDVILASEVDIDGYLLKPFSYEDFCHQLLIIQRTFSKANPTNTWLDKGDEELAQGNIQQARQAFHKALNLTPTSARALVGLARAAILQEDPKAAKASLKAAIDSNPEFIEAYRVMLDLALSDNEHEAIIKMAEYLHSLSPENPRYTLILAKTHLEMREVSGSESYFRKTIALSPRLAEAYRGLGNVYMLQAEYEKAMKNFNKALDLDKDDISTLNSLGLAMVRLGDYENGIHKYLMALKLDPHDHRVLFNIGHAFEKKGDYKKAKHYFHQSLSQKPGYSRSLRGIQRINELLKGKAS